MNKNLLNGILCFTSGIVIIGLIEKPIEIFKEKHLVRNRIETLNRELNVLETKYKSYDTNDNTLTEAQRISKEAIFKMYESKLLEYSKLLKESTNKN